MRGFSLLSSGTVITQAVSLALAPILTRLYSPAEYGVNAVYISLLTICGVAATLRLQVPVAISQNADDRRALSRISIASAVVVSTALLLLVIIAGPSVSDLVGAQSIGMLWALPLGTLMIAVYHVMTQNLLSLKHYKSIAMVGVLSVASQGTFQVALSFAGIGYMGLIAGNLLAYGVTIGYMLVILRPSHRPATLPIEYYREVMRRHIDFPRYAFPAELASIASYSVIPIAITALFGTSAAGFYALGNRLIGIPIQLFGDTIRQVYLREASLELSERGNLARSFYRTSKLLALIAIPSAVLLFLAAPWAFGIVFDDRWAMSGVYVRAMIPLFLARLIVGPLTSTMNITGRQRAGLWFHLVLMAGVLLVWFGYRLAAGVDPLPFLITLSVVCAAIFGVLYYRLQMWVRADVEQGAARVRG